MKFQRKVQTIDAYTFPIEVSVSQPDNPEVQVRVPVGDYFIIADGAISGMTKKQFHAAHDPIDLTEPRESAPRVKKKSKARGLKGAVSAPHPQPPNGVEQTA